MKREQTKHFTQIPNEVLDTHMADLRSPELRVLLVILRQTVGFVYKDTSMRKKTDWISRSFFMRKTNLNSKSVSMAIASLVDKNLVVAFDGKGELLKEPQTRKGKKRIYYAYAPLWYETEKNTMVRKLTKQYTGHKPVYLLPSTSVKNDTRQNKIIQK